MEHCRGRLWKLGGIWLTLFLFLSVLGYQEVRAAVPQPEEQFKPPIEAEMPPEKKEKPPEKPPEVLPKYLPGAVQYAPYSTTFEAGPSTGMLAPYGYAAAEATLIRGWEHHRLGPVRVSPYLAYDGIYRSNVFQTYSSKKADFLNTVSPGLRFELPVAGKHRLSLGYLGTGFLYSTYNNLDHYDQNVNADAALNFSKLSVRTGAAFRAATEEPTAILGPTFQVSRQRFYYRTTPYLSAAYKVADLWRAEGSYQFDDLTFPNRIDRLDDYQYNTFGGTLFYKFWPKTSALVQYIAVIRDHPNDSTRNNVVHTPLVGLTWAPTAKLTGTVKFGYTIANYNQNLPGGESNPGAYAMSIQTVYKYNRFTSMSLIAQRSIQEDPDSASSSYVNTGFFLTLNHYWHYFKVTSYASFSYYNNRYLFNSIDPATGVSERREDNIYSAGIGFSRPITRWLRAKIDYLYYDRGSNFGFVPYNQHNFIFGLQSSY